MIKAATFLIGAFAATCAHAAQIVVKADGAGIVEAQFAQDANVYPHRVLGDILEKLALTVRDDQGQDYTLNLTTTGTKRNVFEDIAPRIADIDQDGRNDVVVIETDPHSGASLAVYSLQNGTLTKIASTPHIGMSFRWLAPIGIADFNGDGAIDIAYIDRPHLAKTLRVFSYLNGELVETATAKGHTNHKIGWDFIAGGVRDCGQGPEMITATKTWADVVATQMVGKTLKSRKVGAYTGPDSLKAALTC